MKRTLKASKHQVADVSTTVQPEVPPPSIQDRMDISVVEPTSFGFANVNVPVSVTTEESTKRRPGSSQAWHAHKRSVIQQNPNLSAIEQLVLAKKSYEPAGRQRSLQSIHKEVFLLRNPNHGLGEPDLSKAIRSDFLSRI
jgi:hypothetical protein